MKEIGRRERVCVIIVREIAVFLDLGGIWGKRMLTPNLGVLFQCDYAEHTKGMTILMKRLWKQGAVLVILWLWS